MGLFDSLLNKKTKWRFSGSQGAGFTVQTEGLEVSLGGGTGTYYVTDPKGISHGLRYVNVEAGIGLSVSPIVTLFGSLKSFPSGGVGYIYKGPLVSSDLELDDFKSGVYAGLNLSKGTIGASADITLIFMGLPWLSLADPFTSPVTLMQCNAVGVMWSVNARTEIGVGAISGSRGKIF